MLYKPLYNIMNGDNLEPELRSELDSLLQPYIERLSELEKSHQERDVDIVLLNNAVENLMRQLDDYRDKIKKLPKGNLMSKVRERNRSYYQMGKRLEGRQEG